MFALFAFILFLLKEADKNFKRLTPSQPVGLRYANVVLEVKEVISGPDGEPVELRVVCKPLSDGEKPKGFIHWVSDPMVVEARLYERLFRHKAPEDPNEVPGGFLSDCNPDSMRAIPNALADRSLAGAKVYDKFQFERVGFFSVDPDSTAERVRINSDE